MTDSIPFPTTHKTPLFTFFNITTDRLVLIEQSILRCMVPGSSISDFLACASNTINSLNLSSNERDYAFTFLGSRIELNNHLHNYSVLFGPLPQLCSDDDCETEEEVGDP
jgi:hypothetical protein